jgi:hypothetical protein
LIANSIHRRILTQIFPVVKSVFGDLFGVSRIGLDLAEGVVAEVFDEMRVHSTGKNPGLVESQEYRFMITTGALHHGPGFSGERADQLRQVTEPLFGVLHIERLSNDHSAGLENGDGAFTFGNINTDCVQHT